MIKDLFWISVILLGIDSIYLTLTTPHFRKVVKQIQKSPLTIDYGGAFLSYIFLIIGYYYFIHRNKNATLIDAMILGWVIYAVFDGTNKAMFNNYTWLTVLMDAVWGGLLFGLVYSVYNTIHKL